MLSPTTSLDRPSDVSPAPPTAQDIGSLEAYVDASQVIQFFCSSGYFKSKNCLREVQSTLDKGKEITLMADPEKGGASLEVIIDDSASSAKLVHQVIYCPPLTGFVSVSSVETQRRADRHVLL